MNACIEWKGAKDTKGYGRRTIKQKNYAAHRVAWEAVNGMIPKGLGVCHCCDNPACINVEHLFLGDQSVNMLDCSHKGRLHTVRGEKNGKAKLTDDDVRAIRQLWDFGFSVAYIARRFGARTSASWIGTIARRKAWTHIT